jgi:hypothetical protein
VEKKQTLERRSAKLIEARADKDDIGPRIVGTAAVYDVVCDPLMGYEEYVKRGFFAPVLGHTDTVCIFNHDNNWLLGRTTSKLQANGKHTLELEDAKDGLHFVCYPPDTVFGRTALENINRGDVQSCSFQFIIEKDEWSGTANAPVRELVLCDRLFDVSPVTFAAYPATSVDLRTVLESGGINIPELRAAYARRQIDGAVEGNDLKVLTNAFNMLSRLLKTGGPVESPISEAQVREPNGAALKIEQIRKALFQKGKE